MQVREEPKISKDGLVGTILFHALLLLLFGFLYLPLRVESFENEGILINFGTSDQGTGSVQPVSENAAASESQPEPAQPEESSAPATEKQTPKPVSQTEVEKVKDKDAKALPTAQKDKSKSPDKKPAEKPKTTPTKETQKPAKQPDKAKPSSNTSESSNPAPKVPEKKEPEIDKTALFPGSKSNNSTGQGNSANAKNEDLGSKMGEVDISPNTGTTSPGKGKSGVGASVAGRNALSLPLPAYNSQEEGTVVIKIKVNQNGEVTDAVFQSAGSTTANSTLVKAAIAAAKKAKFNADVNAPTLVTGTITYNFMLK